MVKQEMTVRLWTNFQIKYEFLNQSRTLILEHCVCHGYGNEKQTVKIYTTSTSSFVTMSFLNFPHFILKLMVLYC